MPDRVRWICSYVVKETDGRIVRSASTRQKIPKLICEHARRVGMPGDQIFPVVKTVIIRDDWLRRDTAA